MSGNQACGWHLRPAEPHWTLNSATSKTSLMSFSVSPIIPLGKIKSETSGMERHGEVESETNEGVWQWQKGFSVLTLIYFIYDEFIYNKRDLCMYML